MEAEAQIYCALMKDLKRRLEIVQSLGVKQQSSALSEFETEICCLHLRRILEAIAFSSLAANRVSYEQNYPAFDTHWKAEKILKKLSDIHPKFYPVPIQACGNNHFVPISDPYLSPDQFKFIYDCTSNVIHTWNPYRKDPRVVNFEKPLIDWFWLIFRLLNFHYCHIADSSKLFVVQLQSQTDQEVHVYLADSASKI